MTFTGWTIAELGPLFLAGAAAITGLYLLRMRRRQLVVPFAALWQQVTRESDTRRLWRRLRRVLSWLFQLALLALLCLALGDPRPEVWLRDPRTLAIVVDRSASMGGPAADEPGVTRLDLPNSHLQYAVTWYGLAAALAVVLALFLRRRGRDRAGTRRP